MIEKNSALRERLQALRKRVAEAQALKFQEWVGFQRTLDEKSLLVTKLNEDQLQLESSKLFYQGRHKVQSDLESELQDELNRQKMLRSQK